MGQNEKLRQFIIAVLKLFVDDPTVEQWPVGWDPFDAGEMETLEEALEQGSSVKDAAEQMASVHAWRAA